MKLLIGSKRCNFLTNVYNFQVMKDKMNITRGRDRDMTARQVRKMRIFAKRNHFF
jgi:hypothetical protein